jgi:hypothetical protein
LRGRDQEDLGLKPAKANSLLDHISKKKKKKERKKEKFITKKGWWSGSRCKP